MNSKWIERLLTGINAERQENGLEPLDWPTVEAATTMIGHQISRDGWRLGLSSAGLVTLPPPGFDPTKDMPRCPLTGTLFDEAGKVSACAHDWQVSDEVRQCRRCRCATSI